MGVLKKLSRLSATKVQKSIFKIHETACAEVYVIYTCICIKVDKSLGGWGGGGGGGGGDRRGIHLSCIKAYFSHLFQFFPRLNAERK